MNFTKIILFIILIIANIHSKGLEKVSIQLDWLHQFQFAGYYMAKEKGFYKDALLDVNIKEFNFDVNLLNDVLNKNSLYAVGKSSLIIDKLEGKDVVLLAAIYQSSPMVLISLKKNNISTILNLKNKKVMLTPDARTAASINSMIISQGLKLEDINFQKHSFKLEDLINGTTDAMGSYLSNEPYILEQQNIKYDIHNPSDYGFNFYGGLLFTSKDELINHPLRVKRMHEATLKGWDYAFNNIEETAQLIYDKYNTQNKTLDSLIYEGKVLKKLAKHKEGQLGTIDYERIDEIKRLYLLLGLGSNSNDFKINEFIYNPYKVHLSSAQKEYLKKNYLTFLTNNDYAPYIMYENDELTGIELDYWNLILKKLNIKSDINIIKDEKQGRNILKNNPNSVKFAYSISDYINKDIELTNTITGTKIALATLNNKSFVSDIRTLKGKKIALPKFSILYEKIKNNYPELDFLEVKDLDEGLNLLTQNKVYGVIGKLHVLSYRITNDGLTNMKISATFDEKFDMKLLVNKNNQVLKEILNEAISKITNEEKNSINIKYNTVIYETSIDYSWVYKIILPLVVIIFIVTLSNRKLNKEIKRRKEIESELFKVANIDVLTNIYNRRKIEELYNKELHRSKRYERELSVIFFDIDNFKVINDDLGHAIGDTILTKVATLVKTNIRQSDHFGRWGGEEFIIVLPETSKEQALNVAHALKDKIAQNDFNIDRVVTCSFGVARYENTDTADSLLTRVDHAMYYVKKNGKNGVKVA